jgi:SAM-dependent methyltransferase
MLSGARRALGEQLRFPAGVAGSTLARLLGYLNADSNKRAIEALAVGAGDKVLEFGCGSGDALRLIAQGRRASLIAGIDHSPTMIAHAARRGNSLLSVRSITLLRGRLDMLPFCSEVFDRILAVHVAYFFSLDGIELKEAYRVLKRGGRILLLVTEKAVMTRWGFDMLHSHRLLDRQDILHDLTCAGFAPDGITVTRILLHFGVSALLAIAVKPAGVPSI